MMMQSNKAAIDDAVIRQLILALTDVTGFGLIGHLCEMVDACVKARQRRNATNTTDSNHSNKNSSSTLIGITNNKNPYDLCIFLYLRRIYMLSGSLRCIGNGHYSSIMDTNIKFSTYVDIVEHDAPPRPSSNAIRRNKVIIGMGKMHRSNVPCGIGRGIDSDIKNISNKLDWNSVTCSNVESHKNAAFHDYKASRVDGTVLDFIHSDPEDVLSEYPLTHNVDDNVVNVSMLNRVSLLFDPQTSGGLLLAVDARHLSTCLNRLRDLHKYQYATVIAKFYIA